MEGKKAKRKLTAILSADVKGYSHLMQDDEEATVRTITAYREVMSSLIQEHDGRVVDAKGDNLLAEFPSVVDAVRCGVEIQKQLKVRNDGLPENRRMEFRIGINLGDVIEEEETIYGDGVNIAARLEGLAEGGGICISRTAFDQVKNKLEVGYKYLGEHSVKNIAEPVRVYKVPMESEYAGKIIGEEKPKRWSRKALAALAGLVLLSGGVAIWDYLFRPPSIEPASVERMAYPLPDKPSIVVLPFKNLGDDPEQEYFIDGLASSIITQLYKMPNIFVISRPSSFSYKGKPIEVRQVAEEMGVRYVLEGSAQKSGERIRINVQLIDALTGENRWAESYDRQLKDVFAVQDEIMRKVVTEIAVEVSMGKIVRGMIYGTNNYEALDCYLKADKLWQRYEKESNAQARELLIKAIELDPKYARAIGFLGYTHLWDARLGWVKDRAKSVKQAEELAKRSVNVDDTVYMGHLLLGSIYEGKRLYEQAIAAKERAIECEPNNVIAIGSLASTMLFAGKVEKSLVLMNKMNRQSPYPWGNFLAYEGWANYLAGRYEAATKLLKKYLERKQQGAFAYISRAWLIASYMELGRMEEAQTEAKRCLEQHPDYSIEAYIKAIKTQPFRDYAFLDRQVELLRKAGVPKHPPLPLPDKPSIAVLPFVNISDDKTQEYFSDGLTEEIITALAKTPQVFVIASNSSFVYKGKPVNVKQVSEELGVRFVLEGSVRKSGNNLRITAQLIDATTGNHLWADRFDREMKEIFAIQDEITLKIISYLGAKLRGEQLNGIYTKGTKNLEAYLKFLQGRELLNAIDKKANALARKKYEEAIALDPKYALAYAHMGISYAMDFARGINRKESMKKVFECTGKARSLDDSLMETYTTLEFINGFLRQHDKAIASAEKAVSIAPGSAHAHFSMGRALNWACRDEEALIHLDQALRMNPFPPAHYFMHIGSAHFNLGNHEEAVSASKRALAITPMNEFARNVLMVTYVEMGRMEEARAELQEFLKRRPLPPSAEGYRNVSPWKDPKVTERYVEAWRPLLSENIPQ